MSTFLQRFSQYTLVPLLLLLTLQAIAAEAPSKRVSLQGISHLSFAGDVSVTLMQSDENNANIVVKKGELNHVEIEQTGSQLWIGNHGRGFWSWFKSSKTSEVNIDIKISDISRIDSNGSVTITSQNITANQLNLYLSGASQFTAGTLTADQLQLNTSGSAKFTATSVQAKTLSLGASGASYVRITGAGSVESQTLNVSGASHYDSSETITKDVKADLSGASFAKIKATRELSGNISGAASLEYSGEPKTQLNTSGASSITKL